MELCPSLTYLLNSRLVLRHGPRVSRESSFYFPDCSIHSFNLSINSSSCPIGRIAQLTCHSSVDILSLLFWEEKACAILVDDKSRISLFKSGQEVRSVYRRCLIFNMFSILVTWPTFQLQIRLRLPMFLMHLAFQQYVY